MAVGQSWKCLHTLWSKIEFLSYFQLWPAAIYKPVVLGRNHTSLERPNQCWLKAKSKLGMTACLISLRLTLKVLIYLIKLPLFNFNVAGLYIFCPILLSQNLKFLLQMDPWEHALCFSSVSHILEVHAWWTESCKAAVLVPNSSWPVCTHKILTPDWPSILWKNKNLHCATTTSFYVQIVVMCRIWNWEVLLA